MMFREYLPTEEVSFSRNMSCFAMRFLSCGFDAIYTTMILVLIRLIYFFGFDSLASGYVCFQLMDEQ